MADNVVTNAGAGGETFATDEIAGVHYPISKLAHGAADSATLVSSGSPLPVTDPNTALTVKQKNAASSVTDYGQVMLAQRRDSDTAETTGDGQYTALKQDQAGRLKVATQPGDVTATTGSITAAAQTVFIQTTRISNLSIAMVATTLVGHNCIFEVSNDSTNGTDGNWKTVQAVRTDSNTIETTTGVLAATPAYAWELNVASYAYFRIRCTAHTSGTAAYTLKPGAYATEPVPSSQNPSLIQSTYSVAGVIAINTTLLTIDCLSFKSISVQCTSMGTTGVVTPQWSNDGTNWITATMLSESGAASTTFNAAALRNTNVMARYFRLQLTTATTGGTTTLNVQASQAALPPIVTTQPVSGTVTANIGTGSVAAGTNAIGDVGVQYRANATGAASVVSALSPATPAAGTIKASAGRLLGWQLQNSSAGVRSVKIFNATAPTLGTTAAIFEIDIPAGGRSEIQLPGGIGFATAMTWSCTSAKGLTDNTATGLAANDVSGAFFFA